jgi:hypothetical protein
MNTPKPVVKIDDWAVVPNPNTGTFRELGPGNLLVGRVFGHPRIQEGAFIFTSPVIGVDQARQVVETRNTAYVLGKVNHEYHHWREEHGIAA